MSTEGNAAPTSAASSSPRERRKAKARLDIARAALRLFQEKGYEATTAADIARAADFSERSFYRYFATKEDVVFFDIEGLLEEVRDAITGVAPDRMWDHVRDSVIGSVARFHESGQEFATEVLRTWMTDPALAGPFQRFCQRWQSMLAERWCTAHGGTDPDSDIDAQLAAHYVVSTCQACFRVHALTGRELQPLLRHGFERLRDGLGHDTARNGAREVHTPSA
jgi:AcrR family transcriptional regulator